tara:strand:+ start:441 stop:644 length:204 start_codon:yes stop_codon:yes gene_type:complete
MVKGLIHGLMGESMRESGNIKKMVKRLIHGLMEGSMREGGKKVKDMVKGYLKGLMEVYGKVSLRIMN